MYTYVCIHSIYMYMSMYMYACIMCIYTHRSPCKHPAPKLNQYLFEAYVSIHQHPPKLNQYLFEAYVSIHQHPSAYISIRQHPSVTTSMFIFINKPLAAALK